MQWQVRFEWRSVVFLWWRLGLKKTWNFVVLKICMRGNRVVRSEQILRTIFVVTWIWNRFQSCEYRLVHENPEPSVSVPPTPFVTWRSGRKTWVWCQSKKELSEKVEKSRKISWVGRHFTKFGPAVIGSSLVKQVLAAFFKYVIKLTLVLIRGTREGW